MGHLSNSEKISAYTAYLYFHSNSSYFFWLRIWKQGVQKNLIMRTYSGHAI